MKVIGLGHYSRTGKDSFANYLIEALHERDPQLRVGKKPFAEKLKDICHQLYKWDGLREMEFYDTPEGAPLRDVPLPVIGKTPVQIWVDMGTPAVREKVYINTWIDYVLKTDHGLDVLIIPDVRFYNEIEAVRSAGGTLIKIVRPGYGPRKTHPDRAVFGYTGWDNVIGEEGSMKSLQVWADRYAAWILGGLPIIRTPAEIEAALKVQVIEPWEDDIDFEQHVEWQRKVA